MLSNGIKVIDRYSVVDIFLHKYDSGQYRHYDVPRVYNELQNSCSIKFKIFNINTVRVFVLFKHVQIYSAKFYRLIGFPIAENGDKQLEIALFNKLRTCEDIREAYISSKDLERIGNLNLKAIDIDFYTDLNKLDSIFDNKWKSKQCYNRYKDDIEVRFATIDDYTSINNLYKSWVNYKDSTRDKAGTKAMFKKFFKHFEEYLNNTLVMTYKGDIISFSIWDLDFDVAVKIAENSYNIHNRLPKYDNDANSKNLFRKASDLFYYLSCMFLKDIGHKGFTVAGASSYKDSITDDSLLMFKNRYAHELIHYYVIPMGGKNEYNKRK